jgi:LysR family transcriptional regulator for metE and metH
LHRAALQHWGYEIDILITPDPIEAPGTRDVPAFDYELKLAFPDGHLLSRLDNPEPVNLLQETLFTYRVPPEWLDVFTQLLVSANCRPPQHQNINTTKMMLQLVAADRGVSTIPNWLVRQEATTLGSSRLDRQNGNSEKLSSRLEKR